LVLIRTICRSTVKVPASGLMRERLAANVSPWRVPVP
jgi:hypothetical protein